METIDLNKYPDLDIKILRKILFLLERVTNNFDYKDNIHEELIDYMRKPFVDILIHNGVILTEENF